MEFSDACPCCDANQKLFIRKKEKQSLAAKRYYDKNRDKIIVDILKKYYRRKQQNTKLEKKISVI